MDDDDYCYLPSSFVPTHCLCTVDVHRYIFVVPACLIIYNYDNGDDGAKWHAVLVFRV